MKVGSKLPKGDNVHLKRRVYTKGLHIYRIVCMKHINLGLARELRKLLKIDKNELRLTVPS